MFSFVVGNTERKVMKQQLFLIVVGITSLLGVRPTAAQSFYEPYSFTTLAGLALNSGTNDNPGDSARFDQPWGVTVDSAGNVFVADTLNHSIRKITSAGVVTTLAGVAGSAGFNDGAASAAQFNRPTGVAVNSAGTVVYVADYNNHVIRQISGGVVTTLAGSVGVSGTNDATGTAAQFHNPFGVAVNSAGTVVYVADQNNQTIRMVTVPGGVVTTLAGSAGVDGSTDGPNNVALFNTPKGVAVDSAGNVYVADAGNFTVRKILFSGGVSTLAGAVFTAGAADGPGGAARFSQLEASGPFGGPCGVAVDSADHVYVADQGNQTIRKIAPDGSVTTLAGLALIAGSDDGTGSAARFHFPAGLAADSAGNLYVADTVNHTIRVGENTADCPSVAPLDANGNLIVPAGLDTNLITYVEVNRRLGTLAELYPTWDTSVDLWYTNLNCRQSIGGIVPTNATSPDFTGALAAIGITNVLPEEISLAISNWNVQIAAQAVGETNHLSLAGPIGPPYVPPAQPHCPDPNLKYAFGGRDIIFVHGLQVGHIIAKIALNHPAMQTWVTPTNFPGSAENPEFYANGYFKGVAEDTWAAHIQKFLQLNGYKNRYLIVAYPCTERLEVGAQAILTQISDAMHFGTGVKDVDPNGVHDTANFGTPSFVIVSHSTGTLISDVAMTAAALHPNLGAGYIPQLCKAHVAMDGVFSGSDLATAAIAISGYISNPTLDWACPLAQAALAEFDPNFPQGNCTIFDTFISSILVDLVPLVAQLKWGSYLDQMPVRTLTLVGGHPTFLRPLKYLFHPGFDDGVTTINSQVGNPNSWFLWPSGFRPSWPGGTVEAFDMGVAGTGNGQQSGLMSPHRAVGYYIDQVVEPVRLLHAPILIAGGATPYISPSGMRQNVADDFAGTPFSTLNRYYNHFSYLQSASDHLAGYTGTMGFYTPGYFPTYTGLDSEITLTFEPNLEESRVITDPAVYTPFAMYYPGDNAPLLDRNCVPTVEAWERGRYIPPIQFTFFGHHYTWGPWWIWRRVYDLLENWQTKMGCDYMYESVLHCPPLASCRTGTVSAVGTPIIIPAGGTFTNSVKVTLGCLTAGATIHYTTNGLDPSSSSPAYKKPGLTLINSVTLIAQAFKGTNASALAIATFTITVPPPPTIATTSLVDAIAKQRYTATLQVYPGTGNPRYKWTLVPKSKLPAGLTLNATKGLISGRPTKTGTFNFTVKVTDAKKQIAMQSLTLIITAGP